jgi:hypothetical protein
MMYCSLLLSYIFRYKISALRSFTLAPTEDCYMLPIIKFHPRTGHKGPDGEQMYSSTFPSTSALDEGGWSKPRPGRFTSWKDSVPIPYVTYTTHFPHGSPDSRVIGTKFPPSPPPQIPDDLGNTVLLHCIIITQSKYLHVEPHAHTIISRFSLGLG